MIERRRYALTGSGFAGRGSAIPVWPAFANCDAGRRWRGDWFHVKQIDSFTAQFPE
jgi:hypothetical protein